MRQQGEKWGILAAAVLLALGTVTLPQTVQAVTALSGDNAASNTGGATAGGKNATAVGDGSSASEVEATAIGYKANASGKWSVAIGTSNEASGNGAIAIGYSKATGAFSQAYGHKAEATGTGSIALGASASATYTEGWDTLGYTIAIGANAKASGNAAVVVGAQAEAKGEDAVALGSWSSAAEYNGVAIGRSANAEGKGGSSVGARSEASGFLSSAFGYGSKATNQLSSAFAYGSQATGVAAVAVGGYSLSSGTAAFAAGNKSHAYGASSIAIGHFSTVYESTKGGTAIGYQSVAKTALAEEGTNKVATVSFGHQNGDTYTDVNSEDKHVSAVYSDTLLSRLTNVADGKTNTDAATYGQIAKTAQSVTLSTAKREAVNGKDIKGNEIAANDGTVLATFTPAVATLTASDTGFVSGGALFSEVRPSSGKYVSANNTTATNLANLDTKIGEGKTADSNLYAADADVETQIYSVAGKTIKEVSSGATSTEATKTQKITLTTYDKNTTTIEVAGQGSVASGDVRLVDGSTVYTYLSPTEAGNYIKTGATNTTAQNLAALDNAIGKTSGGYYIEAQDGSTKTVATNLKALDEAIGQKLTGNDYNAVKSGNSVTQNLKALDDAIGTYGVAKTQTIEATEAENKNKITSLDGKTTLATFSLSTAKSLSGADTGFVSGAVLFDEVRVTKDNYNVIAKGNTAAANFEALDKAIGKKTGGTYVKAEDSDTVYSNLTALDTKIGTITASGLKTVLQKNSVSQNLEALDQAIQSSDTATAGLITLNQAKDKILIGSGTDAANATDVSFAYGNTTRKLTGLTAGVDSTDAATVGQTINAVTNATSDNDKKKVQTALLKFKDTTKDALSIAVAGEGTVDGEDLRLISGQTLYNENRKAIADSTDAKYYVSENNTAAANLLKLDAAIGGNTDIETTGGYITNKASVNENLKALNAKAVAKDQAITSANNTIKSVDKKTTLATFSFSTAKSLSSSDSGFVSGAVLYNEVRPTEAGKYVNNGKTTGENLKALDDAIGDNTDIETAGGYITNKASVNANLKALNAKAVVAKQNIYATKTDDKNVIKAADGTALATFNVSTTDSVLKSEKTIDNGFVSGDVLYNYTKPVKTSTTYDLKYAKTDQTVGTNLGALDAAIQESDAKTAGLITLNQNKDKISIGAGTDAAGATEVSFANGNATRRLTDVTAGLDDTDAVNVKQLYSAYVGSDTISITKEIDSAQNVIRVKNMAMSTVWDSAKGPTAAGNYSFAIGGSADASGNYAYALGSGSKATGYGSVALGGGAEATWTALPPDSSGDTGGTIAIGQNAKASGNGGAAIGAQAVATGEDSVAFGSEAGAAGYEGTAIGSSASAGGVSGTAIGAVSNASGIASSAFGYYSKATGDASTTLGYGSGAMGTATTSVGAGAKAYNGADYSIAIGVNSETQAQKSVAIGYESVASEANTVSFGHKSTDTHATVQGAVAYRTDSLSWLTNVADGRKTHEAATWDQLIASSQSVTFNSKTTSKDFINNHGDTVISVAIEKGTVSKDSTGYVTGGDVWNAIAKYNQTIDFSKVSQTTGGATGGQTGQQTGGQGGAQTTQDSNKIYTNDGQVIATITQGKVASGDTNMVSGGDVWNADIAKDQSVKFNSTTTSKTFTNNKGEDVFKVEIEKGAVAKDNTGFTVGADVWNADIAKDQKIYLEDGKNELKNNNGDVLATFHSSEVAQGDSGFVSGGDLFEEVRPADGLYVKQDMTTGENLNALDAGLVETNRRLSRVGAGAAALAALRPEDFNPTDKWSFAVGYGHYQNANAGAFGVFYKPNMDTTVSLGSTIGNGNTMVNAGVSFKIGKRGKEAGAYRNAAAVGAELASLRKSNDKLLADNKTLQKDNAVQAKEIRDLKADNEKMQKQIAMILSKMEMSGTVTKTATK